MNGDENLVDERQKIIDNWWKLEYFQTHMDIQRKRFLFELYLNKKALKYNIIDKRWKFKFF